MTEDGWGCGYIVLHNSNEDIGVPEISWDRLLEIQGGLHIDDELKGPLLRREIRLADVIRGKKYLDDDGQEAETIIY